MEVKRYSKSNYTQPEWEFLERTLRREQQQIDLTKQACKRSFKIGTTATLINSVIVALNYALGANWIILSISLTALLVAIISLLITDGKRRETDEQSHNQQHRYEEWLIADGLDESYRNTVKSETLKSLSSTVIGEGEVIRYGFSEYPDHQNKKLSCTRCSWEAAFINEHERSALARSHAESTEGKHANYTYDS